MARVDVEADGTDGAELVPFISTRRTLPKSYRTPRLGRLDDVTVVVVHDRELLDGDVDLRRSREADAAGRMFRRGHEEAVRLSATVHLLLEMERDAGHHGHRQPGEVGDLVSSIVGRCR